MEVAVETFSNLASRLNILQTSDNPSEATNLLKWVRSGGLASLYPGLVAYLRSVVEGIPVPSRDNTLFALVGPSAYDLYHEYILAVGTSITAIEDVMPANFRAQMYGLASREPYYQRYRLYPNAPDRVIARFEILSRQYILLLGGKPPRTEHEMRQAFKEQFWFVALQAPVVSGEYVETGDPAISWAADASDLQRFEQTLGRPERKEEYVMEVEWKPSRPPSGGVEAVDYVFGVSADQLFDYLAYQVEPEIRYLETAQVLEIGPAMWVDQPKYSKITGAGMTGRKVTLPPAALTYSFQSILEARPEMKYETGIAAELKNCLSGSDYARKYTFDELFEGIGTVVIMRLRDNDSKALRLAEAVCLQPQEVPREYKWARRITDNIAAFSGKYANGANYPLVSELKDCALVPVKEIQSAWEPLLPDWAQPRLEECHETYYFIPIYDNAEMTLYTTPWQDISRVITPSLLFELYLVVTQLLEQNIGLPRMYATRVGLVQTDEPVYYKIGDCTVATPAGLHARLLGYRQYDERTVENEYFVDEEKTGPADNGEVYEVLNKLWIKEGTNLVPHFEDSTYLDWEVIARLPDDVPAATMLYNLARHSLGCVTPPSTLGEMKSSVAIPEEVEDYSEMWSSGQPVQPTRPLSPNEAQDLKTNWRSIFDQKFVETYPGIEAFALDYIRTLPESVAVTVPQFKNDLKAAWSQLTLRQKLYYRSIAEALALSRTRDQIITAATQSTNPMSMLTADEMRQIHRLYRGSRARFVS